MKRLDDPAQLGDHLAETAAAWQKILGGDASSLEVFGRVEALARNWQALQRDVLTPFGVNYAESAALGILRTSPDGRCSLVALRRLIGQSSAGMTRVLDKLVAEAWVVREDGGADRRRVDVRLTESGAALADEATRALLIAQSKLLAQLEREQRSALRRALDALLRVFGSRSP